MTKNQRLSGITPKVDSQLILLSVTTDREIHLIHIPLLVKNVGKDYVKLTNLLTFQKPMNNPFTLYEQEVMTALYKSLNYCEENDLPTYEISQALFSIENKIMKMEVI